MYFSTSEHFVIRTHIPQFMNRTNTFCAKHNSFKKIDTHVYENESNIF